MCYFSSCHKLKLLHDYSNNTVAVTSWKNSCHETSIDTDTEKLHVPLSAVLKCQYKE